jgi:hypothetical protein
MTKWGERKMSVHVKKGTPRFGPSLCDTCSSGHVLRGCRENEQMVVCEATYLGHSVPFPVKECSSYAEKKQRTLRDLEKMAWILEAKGNKRVPGFVAPGTGQQGTGEIEMIISAPGNS